MASKFLKIPRPMTSNTCYYVQKKCYAILQNFDNNLLRPTTAARIEFSTWRAYPSEFERDNILEENLREKNLSAIRALKQLRMHLYESYRKDTNKYNSKCTEEVKRADDLARIKKTPKKLPKLEPCICPCPEREIYTPTYTPKLKRLKPLYDDSQMKWRHNINDKNEVKSERMDDIRGYKPKRKKLPAYLKSSPAKKRILD